MVNISLAFRIFPPRPQASNAQRLAARVTDAGWLGLPASPVGFKDGFHRKDAVQRLAPSIAEAGLFGHCFGAGVAGVRGDLGVGRPTGDQAKAAEQCFMLVHRVIAHIGISMAANEGAFAALPDIAPAQLAGQTNAKALFQPGLFMDGFVVGALA